MGLKTVIGNLRVALLLTGSAACVFACGGKNHEDDESLEGLMTQRAEHLKMVESTNGRLSYRFQAPLMETYEYDREPFREFRKGIVVETFSDSTNTVETTLIGDYAIHYLERSLWEVKGNVVATNANGQKLETQQLFWNQRTERIYSNVDSKLTQGNDVIIGVGFESDEQFVDWEFRRPRGTVEFDVEAVRGEEETDSEDPVIREESEGREDGGALAETGNEAEEGDVQKENTENEITPPARQPLQPVDSPRPSGNGGRPSRTVGRNPAGTSNASTESPGRVRNERTVGGNNAAGRTGGASGASAPEEIERIPITALPDDGTQLIDVPLNRN